MSKHRTWTLLVLSKEARTVTMPTLASMARVLLSIFLLSLGLTTTTGQAAEPNQLSGCVCSIDQAKATLRIAPWNEAKKIYDFDGVQEFGYTLATKVDRVNNVTVADVRSGKAVHLGGLEVKDLSGFQGMRATVHLASQGNQRVVTDCEWFFAFAGETVRVNLLAPEKCPCSSK